jgi:hypothetical protein
MRDDVVRVVVMTAGGCMNFALHGDDVLRGFAVGWIGCGPFLAGCDWFGCSDDYVPLDGWFLCMAGKQQG